MRKIYVGCGPLSDAQLRHLARHSARRDETTGRLVSLTDPNIATAFQWLWYCNMPLWSNCEKLKPPVLTLHSDSSDFVTPDLLVRMKRPTPGLATFEVADTGHMPMLISRAEADTVLRFLRSHP